MFLEVALKCIEEKKTARPTISQGVDASRYISKSLQRIGMLFFCTGTKHACFVSYFGIFLASVVIVFFIILFVNLVSIQ